MDTLDVHFRRNIQLETELRLVKEQLAQAQQGTQYLVNCFGAQQAQPQYGLNARNEVRTRELEVENAMLRKLLARITDDEGTGTSQSGRGELNFRGHCDPSQPRQNHRAPVSGQQHLDNVYENLVDLGDEPVSPIITKTVPFPASHSVAERLLFTPKPQSGHTGLGISNYSPPQPKSLPEADLLNNDFPRQTTYGVERKSEWQAIRAPAPPREELIFNRPFYRWEDAKLLGMATYLEDFSHQEQKHYFELCARKDDRHSAEEWRMYYEGVVRPKFLARRGGVSKAAIEESVLMKTNVVSVQPEKSGEASEHHDLEDRIVQPSLQGLQKSRWAPKVVEGAMKNLHEGEMHAAQDALPANFIGGPLYHQAINPAPPSDEESSPLSQMSFNHDHELISVADSLPTHGDEADPLAEADQNDLLLRSPTMHSAGNRLVTHSLLPSAMPDSSSEPIEYADHENSFHGRSRGRSGRSRGRFRARNSSNTLPFYKFDSSDPKYLRTVMITNVPTTMTLGSVIGRVRGGTIVHARYGQTAGMRTQPPITKNTVIIRFFHADRAAEFVDFTKQHDIILGYDDNASAIRLEAQLIETPSAPLPSSLYRAIQDKGMTRILFIHGQHSQWKPEEIIDELQCYQKLLPSPLSAGRDEEGVFYFKFADVRYARDALKIMNDDSNFFYGARKGFRPDPCDRPLQIGSASMGFHPANSDDAQPEKDSTGEGDATGAPEVDAAVSQCHEGDLVEVETMSRWTTERKNWNDAKN